jgi:hypothetical protein
MRGDFRGLLRKGCRDRGRLFWLKESESHAMHQEYWRHYQGEEGRVRKVECGLAFEFVFVGEEMDFVEVE